jgi:diaminopimelate decarboxylase/aspartate kinase
MISPKPPWVVLKFGGTSVATAARWRRIADLVRARCADGERPLVVCSAVAGVSDLLEDLLSALAEGRDVRAPRKALLERHRSLARELGVEAGDLFEDLDRRLAALTRHAASGLRPHERPGVLALGELLSTRLGARWLRARGIPTTWLDARELLRASKPLPGASDAQRYEEATCPSEPDAAVAARLAACPTPVVLTQGFIARDPAGRTVVLGRGGSDTAAAYLAAKLGAQRVEIWTDVPGLFSCDPRIEPDARLIPRVTYDEAESLAGFGAQVLHPRTIHPLREGGIPLVVRWTERPDTPGTRIGPEPGSAGLKAIVSRERLGLVTVDKPGGWKPVGLLADIAACFKRNAVPIDLVSSSTQRVRMTVDLSAAGSRERLPRILEELEGIAAARVDHDVASVTLVGRGLQRQLPHCVPVLERVGGLRVLMTSHCASDLSWTVVVPKRSADEVVRTFHRELFRAEPGALTWRRLQPAASGSRGRARTGVPA